MTYRAGAITQRDGSPLANSNCRMASIATGLDYNTLGAKKSTGSKMRSYTDDQSGGTDSGDARQSWDRGYNESLRVMDGHTWADAISDLQSGRMVHIDVWHAKVGGPCVSGSGAYGHTMVIAPEFHSDGVNILVSDPWCQPGKWSWVLLSKLKAGAEYWGSQVYSRAAFEDDYPDDSSGPLDPRVYPIVQRIVKRLMDTYNPIRRADPDDPINEDIADTAGGAILYTTTKAQTEVETVGPAFDISQGRTGVATVKVDGANLIGTADGEFTPVDNGYVRNVTALVVITSGKYDGEDAYLVSNGDTSALLLASHANYVPDPPSGDDIPARDAQWLEWLTAGSPGSDT